MTSYEQISKLGESLSTDDRLTLEAAILVFWDIASGKLGDNLRQQVQREVGTVAINRVLDWGITDKTA